MTYKDIVAETKEDMATMKAMIPPEALERNKVLMGRIARANEVSAKEVKKTAETALAKFTAGKRRTEEQLNAKRKQLLAMRPRLWRKQQNSTEYGVLDGIIEAVRQKANAKSHTKQMKTMQTFSEMGRRMISSLPQPMMPGFTPVVPVRSVTGASLPTDMNADEMAMAVERYRQQQRDDAQRVRKIKKDRRDEEERELQEDDAQVEEMKVERDPKEEKRELNAKAAATAAEQREAKRKADTLARRAAWQKRKREKEDAFNKNLFEEGVE